MVNTSHSNMHNPSNVCVFDALRLLLLKTLHKDSSMCNNAFALDMRTSRHFEITAIAHTKNGQNGVK
jgi:hypothetical protein